MLVFGGFENMLLLLIGCIDIFGVIIVSVLNYLLVSVVGGGKLS